MWKQWLTLFFWAPKSLQMVIAAAAAAAKSLQLCPTLCDPIDSSPPRSTVPGILQARKLEWVAISFSSAWKWKVKVKPLVVSDSSRPQGLQHTRLLCPWDFPSRILKCVAIFFFSQIAHSSFALPLLCHLTQCGVLISQLSKWLWFLALIWSIYFGNSPGLVAPTLHPRQDWQGKEGMFQGMVTRHFLTVGPSNQEGSRTKTQSQILGNS